MARKKRDEIGQQDDLDLAPFMNLVIILIPLLLLSIVFMEVAIIQVQMPLGGSATTDSEEEEEESLDLSITMSNSGFYVSAGGSILPPIEGCPTEGPTICVQDQSLDMETLLDEARQRMMAGNVEAGEDRMEQALRNYNFRELYNMLTGFKADFPDEEAVRLSADSDIPFALTVRVMDVSRFVLEEEEYDDDEAFWAATYQTEMDYDEESGREVERPVVLFGSPAFAVHQ
jgi:biopolymer transport protein ExbD